MNGMNIITYPEVSDDSTRYRIVIKTSQQRRSVILTWHTRGSLLEQNQCLVNKAFVHIFSIANGIE